MWTSDKYGCNTIVYNVCIPTEDWQKEIRLLEIRQLWQSIMFGAAVVVWENNSTFTYSAMILMVITALLIYE